MCETDVYEGMLAETVAVSGAGGDLIYAHLARPKGPGPFPGMVVVHHMPGWDGWYREARIWAFLEKCFGASSQTLRQPVRRRGV